MHILVNTGGGDAPGLNAVIRAVTLSALQRGWKVTGIRKGYDGLLRDDPDGLIDLTAERVQGITHLGGTILGTINKGHPFEYPLETDGKTVLTDVSDRVVSRFKELGADALVAIGGDGSLTIAHRFYELGLPVVGVPKTIDNDLEVTHETFGFDSAVSVVTESIGRLHSTAEAHERVFVVEVMGRDAGWIALHAGIAGTADVILIPEIPYHFDAIVASLKKRYAGTQKFAIIVVAEGAHPVDGDRATIGQEVGKEVSLGGIGEMLAKQIGEAGFETRHLVLGHLQRGGGPTGYDRLLALRLGACATRLIEAGRFGEMAAYQPPVVDGVPIKEAIRRRKLVPVDSDTVQTARDLGICVGD